MLQDFKIPEAQYPQNANEFQEKIFKYQSIEYCADYVLLQS
jgi:hypothetical protein